MGKSTRDLYTLSIFDGKVCLKCRLWKPFTDYHPHRNVYRSYCKECWRIHSNQYAEANREELRAKNREYGKANRAKITARVNAWIVANPERYASVRRAWREAHTEERAEYTRRWQQEHPERVARRNRKWRQANPDKVLAAVHRRRARLQNAEGSYTLEEWIGLCDAYGWKCLACGRTDRPLTIDHVVPIFLGGNNTVDNLQPLCKSCNCSKGPHVRDYRNADGMSGKLSLFSE